MGFISREKKAQSSSSSTSPCAQLRVAYHNCFNRWYSEKFLKGQWDKEECVTEWQSYRACLSQHLDDKHLSRFLESEIVPVDLRDPIDPPTAAVVLQMTHKQEYRDAQVASSKQVDEEAYDGGDSS